MGETYSSLVVQPIDLINAFKVDFCFASVIKWLTKWHMERKNEYLVKAGYYLGLCYDTKVSREFLFALKMYCMVNSFIQPSQSTCLMLDIAKFVSEGRIDVAIRAVNAAI